LYVEPANIFKLIIKHFLNEKGDIWLVAACILILPALLIHLGIMPFTSDEPTRGIITLEMIYSGNFITPTFTGEYYYNKPPLFNWLLAPVLMATGGTSEGWIRVPTILALLGYAGTIWYFVSKEWGSKKGLIAALIFITCGRILFWDSLLALIDILYSWITFAGFMVVITHTIRGNFRTVFLLSYTLTGIGFMLKGMPSLLFQGLTLLAVFIALRQFRRLFTLHHLAGISIFILITGSYLYLYSRENSLQHFISILWDQSSQRTAVQKGLNDTIVHLLSFHPKMIYHFLPWSLLPLLLLRKGNRKMLFFSTKPSEVSNAADGKTDHKSLTIRLMLVVFGVNIIVYWLSPATIPRYVLMLAPLTFIPLYLLPDHPRWFGKMVPVMIVGLLALRIVFNLIWLPEKAISVPEYQQRIDARELVRQTSGKPLQIIGTTWLDHATIMYLTAGRGEILHRTHSGIAADQLYLTDIKRLNRILAKTDVPFTIHDSTFIKHQHGKIYLISFENNFTLP
jgi:4-amino-4-deoxy-L-arabinose transferase-like glycosyltransferase